MARKPKTVLFEDEEWIITRIRTFEECQKYAKSAEWCAAREKNHFDHYQKKGKCFIAHDKTNSISYGFVLSEKDQFVFNHLGHPLPNINLMELLSNNKSLTKTLKRYFNSSTQALMEIMSKKSGTKVLHGTVCISEIEDHCDNLDGLMILGDCTFRRSKIKTIKNLYVEGELNIEDSKLRSITGSLYVGKSLKGKNSNLEHLPEGTVIMGSAALMNSELMDIPKKMTVGCNLYLSNTNIKRIEPDVNIGNHLYLHGIALQNPDEKIRNIGGILKNKTCFDNNYINALK